MNPTVKAVLLNERDAVLSAIAARRDTVSDLLVQIIGVENDIGRLRHRLIDLEAYLFGHRVALSSNGEDAGQGSNASADAPCAPALQVGPLPGEAIGLPPCKPLADFVRPKTGARRALAANAARQIETA
ncbi:hypothetical protein [Methylobacterium sp. P5_C11]